MTDDLVGLDAGDDVRAGGFKIGVVRNIRFEGLDTDAPMVIVTFSIPSITVCAKALALPSKAHSPARPT